MTVHQLDNSMSREELFEWVEYLSHEPPSVDELQMAVLSNIVVRYAGSKNSKYTDFLVRKQQGNNSDDKPISNKAILAVFSAMGTK